MSNEKFEKRFLEIFKNLFKILFQTTIRFVSCLIRKNLNFYNKEFGFKAKYKVVS